MRSTFKVLFYVKKGSEKPNGNLPLMCRITVDGEIKQFSCKMDVPPRLWDVKNSRASGKSVEAQRINLAVDKIRVEVNRRYQELMQTDGTRLVLAIDRKPIAEWFKEQFEKLRQNIRRPMQPQREKQRDETVNVIPFFYLCTPIYGFIF